MPRKTFVHDYDFNPGYGMDLAQLLHIVPPEAPPDFADFWRHIQFEEYLLNEFQKLVAFSGRYDLTLSVESFADLFDGYYDENVYFHTPTHFLPSLDCAWRLELLRAWKSFWSSALTIPSSPTTVT